jgi:ACS family hexuronate transporter-like MFS transporter
MPLDRDPEPGTESVAPTTTTSSVGASATAIGAEVAGGGPEQTGRGVGRYRWVICGLVFLATTINYMDRQVIGILAPYLTDIFQWSEVDYSNIVAAFSFAYAFGYLLMGRFMDWVGVRLGYTVSIVGWSLAAMAHAFARTVPGFMVARAALGITEGGNFPAAIKTVAEWFPKKERAFATGIFNAGTNVGAVLAPILVPWITLTWGWEWAFIVTGSVGFIWALAWWLIYKDPERHPKVSDSELAFIRSDPAEPQERVSWFRLLSYRQTWAFVIAKFMTDPIWWFYLYWLPKFLDNDFGVTLTGLALPLIVIYGVADVGSVFGGWVSGALMNRGWSINAGRKIAMLVAALLIVPTMFAPYADSMWFAVAIVSVAAAAHQWWSANLFTTSSDMFPRWAVASMVGLGGFAGSMGGVLFQKATGWILEATDSNYQLIFLIAGLAYVSALLVFHLIVPRLEPADIGGSARAA